MVSGLSCRVDQAPLLGAVLPSESCEVEGTWLVPASYEVNNDVICYEVMLLISGLRWICVIKNGVAAKPWVD